jgi:hypothetical protein
METKILSANDALISQLDYKLPASSSYIIDRDGVEFFPSGSSLYSPNGNRVIKFNLTDSNKWLDQTSVHLNGKITNLGATAKEFLPAWCLFSRMIIRAGGKIVEDIRDVGTWMQIQNKLTNERANNEYIKAGCEALGLNLTDNKTGSKAQNASYYFSIRLNSGLFNQAKYIPLRFLPLEVELEIDQDTSTFTADNSTCDYSLTECSISCDLITVDNALNDSYSKFMLEGGVIDLHMTNAFNITHNQQSSGSLDESINISRALSRLTSLFFTMSANNTSKNSSFLGLSGDIQVGLKIGSKNIPNRPLKSETEIIRELQRAIAHNRDMGNSIQLNPSQHGAGQIVVGFDLEKELGASYTGLSTKSGELLNINVKSGDTVSRRFNIFVQYDSILSISANGVDIYE